MNEAQKRISDASPKKVGDLQGDRVTWKPGQVSYVPPKKAPSK